MKVKREGALPWRCKIDQGVVCRFATSYGGASVSHIVQVEKGYQYRKRTKFDGWFSACDSMDTVKQRPFEGKPGSGFALLKEATLDRGRACVCH